jgi:hypothetical protein
VTGLLSCTEYDFQVMALNACDDSAFSGTVSATTTCATGNLNMGSLIVTSLLTESPCTSSLFSPAATSPPSIGLRASDTRGKTFGAPVPQPLGTDPLTQLQWNRTGYARDRVYEMFWTAAAPTALNGAFVILEPWKT